jgi:hypothetical protein
MVAQQATWPPARPRASSRRNRANSWVRPTNWPVVTWSAMSSPYAAAPLLSTIGRGVVNDGLEVR